MSKKGSLESLIKSLTKAEKRYFRMFAGLQSGHKNYLKLFNCLEAESNDSARQMGETLNLGVIKNYLGKLILRSLKNFNDGKTKHSEILHLLLEIEILFLKELYDQCFDRIKKGKKVARKYEQITLLFEFLSWERKVMNAVTVANKYVAMEKLLSEENEVLSILENKRQYDRLVNELMQQDFSNSQLMRDYLKHPLLKSEGCAKSFAALVLYYHLHYILHTVTMSGPKGRDIIYKLILALEATPYRIQDNPDTYLTALNNLMGIMLYNRETEGALGILKKIRAVPQKYQLKRQNATLKMFIKTYNVELELYRDLKEWDKALELMEEIQEFINRQTIPANYLLSFYYQFAYIYFQLKRYSDSLSMINTILNNNFGEHRVDLQTYSRFLFLMIHFELGNITLLRYAVENTRRFLKKRRGTLFAFEKELLKFFSKLSVSTTHKYTVLFQKLSSSLFRNHTEKERANILDYLDFHAWINEKLALRTSSISK